MKSNIQHIQVYLPKSLHYLCTVISLDSLLKLIKHHGGTRISLTKKSIATYRLVELIGIDDLTILERLYGGGYFDVPKCNRLLSLSRNIKILHDSRLHITGHKLALKYKMTERGIQKALRRIEPLERSSWIKEIEPIIKDIFN